jgi:hypothetical protein
MARKWKPRFYNGRFKLAGDARLWDKIIRPILMHFEILGRISNVETIASGSNIRERRRLKKLYGGLRWRKRKGDARIQFSDGTICLAEIHWYEAHGIGTREFKIKRILDQQ